MKITIKPDDTQTNSKIFFAGNIVEGFCGTIILIIKVGDTQFEGLILKGVNVSYYATSNFKSDYKQFHGTVTLEV